MKSSGNEYCENKTFVCFLSEKTDFCHNEVFKVRCPEGQLLMITGADYGRMRMGTCVKKSWGILGCSVSVLDQAHRRCSGRDSCEIKVRE